jgi:hypothetical protein
MGFRRFPAAVFARPPVIKAGRGKNILEGWTMNYFSLNKLEKGLLTFLGVLVVLVVLEFALATRYDVVGTVVDKETRYATRTGWWVIPPIGVPTGGGLLYYEHETEVQYVLVVVCMDEEEGRVPVCRDTYQRIEDGQQIRVHGWRGITGIAYSVNVEVVE